MIFFIRVLRGHFKAKTLKKDSMSEGKAVSQIKESHFINIIAHGTDNRYSIYR